MSLRFEQENFAHFVSRPLGENILKDIFLQKWRLLKALKSEAWKTRKRRTCSFCKPPAWWKYSKTSFDKSGDSWKFWRLKNSKKANFAHFVSSQLGENILKDIFWHKWRLLKALKLEKLERAKFCLFCKPPAWWKYAQRHLLTKVVAFESSEVWKKQTLLIL